MFTVCPKCALTLVVTAADLRVAQGYVRCGRCSNVFNALSRLSEDRQAAAAAAQAQASPEPTGAPKAAAPPQQPSDASGSFKARETSASTAAQPRAQQTTSPRLGAGPPEPKRYDDDSIPEEDLEFNADATDINKVFVEQPPSPQFTAATGTFKAIRLEAEGSARPRDQLADTDEREAPAGEHFDPDAPHFDEGKEHFDPTDTQVDVEIDPDMLATMAQFSAPDRANSTPAESARREAPAQKPKPLELAKPKPPAHVTHAKQLLQPPSETPPPAAPSMRLAERAKARAEAARTGVDTTRLPGAPAKTDAKQKTQAPEPKPKTDAQRVTALETTQAIRAALAPRKRPSSYDLTSVAGEEPTSFFAGMWTAGSIALLVLLTLQIVHHYRHDLATNPTLNGPLTAIYAALGIPIVPRWDLNVYEVRQLGATTAGPGQIRVLSSVKNNGHQAQPLPLLRVTLQDRFGNRIASVDVPPQSYLPRAIPSSSLLSAGQRIDAEMTFVDPGANAVGFEIDACLPAPEGGIACANDIAR
jgi:predicted Zn finger-like uncharacterized protein